MSPRKARPTPTTRLGYRRRSQHDVVRVCSLAVLQGRNLAWAAEVLGMNPSPGGSIRMALTRAGQRDLLRALTAERETPRPDILELAERLLAEIPQDGAAVIARRRRVLIGQPQAGAMAVAGRQVRGRNGIVRWVAA